MTELIVAMLVLAIIMLAVTTVFLPIFNIFVHTNNMAEVNTLMNSLSAVIMSDVENANGAIRDAESGVGILIPRINGHIEYTGGGLLLRNGTPVFAEGFYRRKEVEIFPIVDDEGEVIIINGVVTITLVIWQTDRAGDRQGMMATREFAARPVGMQN
jgi:hypothetical protein